MATIDQDFWRDRRVLVTGHTGFKGAWLSLWLQALGARVSGLAPGPPTAPSLYELADVGAHMVRELDCDVRERAAVSEAVHETRPQIVLHLAAQPMVRLSLREPASTFEVNVLGTLNVLEAVRCAGQSVRAVVVVTSDKCYANPLGYERAGAAAGLDERQDMASRGASGPPAAATAATAAGPGAGGVHRFVETDPLGGHDPYSASKAAAELVTAAYRDSFFAAGAPSVRVASARAGNVIGGGDFGADRLVPDILRAYDAGRPVRIRNPGAIRPWQHVLNPLSGYLALAQALCRGVGPAEVGGGGSAAGVDEDTSSVRGGGAHDHDGGARDHDGGARDGNGEACARAYNFGPRAEDARTVVEIVRRLDGLLDGGLGFELDAGENPPEAMRLALDSAAAERELGWKPSWDLDEALAKVASWHCAYRRGEDVRAKSLEQIATFC